VQPLVLAILASVAVVLLGPWVGQIRGAVRSIFPGSYGLVFNLGIAVVAIGAIVAAVSRIQDRRRFRFSMLALSVATAVTAALATASPSAAQNAVERFHFIEYGLLTWLYYRAVLARWRRAPDEAVDPSLLIVPALCTLTVGAADEWLQWFVPERIGEWRDIFLNGTAIAAGTLFSLGVAPPRHWRRRWSAASRRTTGIVAVIATVAIAAFIHVVHVGTMVRHAEIGAFRSRYTGAELAALAADRAQRWTVTPPPMAIRRLSREDQYLAEASWHVQARNEAWEADPARAWLENRILEEYFAPAIDTPSYVMGVTRWPAEQRADALRRVGGSAPAPFESRAERLRLYLISPVWLWAGAAVVAAPGVLLALGRGRAIVTRRRPPQA
jgi:hypothetical protein